jgi:hypothetical protein
MSPCAVMLRNLHRTLQTVMGWTDSHQLSLSGDDSQFVEEIVSQQAPFAAYLLVTGR